MWAVWAAVSLASVAAVEATLGIDVSQPTSVAAFRVSTFLVPESENVVEPAAWLCQCLKAKGYDFAIVRVYQSVGRVDPAAVQNVKNARAGLGCPAH